MIQLIYVADPMCSWCYGFGPELQALLEMMPDANLDIIVGGLRAYNQEVMSEEQRQTIRGHWKHVAEATGLPFAATGMTQAGFKYDTEPACRTVVATKMLADHLSPVQLLSVFRAIQHAFYAEGKDVTDLRLLSDIAVRALNETDGAESFDASSFYETLVSPLCMADTRQEFEQCQRWGIRGFPALLLVHNNALHMIASGFTKRAALVSAIEEIQKNGRLL
ncbi:DsbA family protein [Undibacterium sp. WLX3042]|uniref:DsbA family protein n=1 Tax=Undibacterium sp. WLX3042 TaxID=3412686 RepID=UPI003C2F48C6